MSGLYSGLVAKPDQLLWAGMDKIVSPIAQFVNENTSFNDTSVSYIAEQRKLAEQQVKRLTPDAATTGTAGQVLYGLFDMGGQAVVGSALAGLIMAQPQLPLFRDSLNLSACPLRVLISGRRRKRD